MAVHEPPPAGADGEERDWLLWRQGIDERLTADGADDEEPAADAPGSEEKDV